jgi:fucose 4-O-acetylase-like acetyltransferase
MKEIEKLLYPYFFYGSADSTDKDVVIQIPQTDMPDRQEDRKNLVWQLQKEYHLDWNATLAVIENLLPIRIK